MPEYVLTGTPGSGKTALLRRLELDGHTVVEEAATDVIALRQAYGRPNPWRDPSFLDDVLALQLRRAAAARGRTVFFDRSPVCTLALARYSDLPPSPALTAAAAATSGRTVFFVRHLGFVERTAARRISLADALRFERIHEETYRELGFDLVDVPAGPMDERLARIGETLACGGGQEFRTATTQPGTWGTS
jgi:predicted ATPase